MSFNINKNFRKPLYEQIYSHIKKAIIDGKLSFGTRLPAKKKLSEGLGISQTPVEIAYEQLVAEGFIISKPRSGFFVQADEELIKIPNKNFKTKPIHEKFDNEIEFDFHPGRIETDLFPFSTWKKIHKQVLSKENSDILNLGCPTGELELRSEIANYLFYSRGVNCSVDQIVIGSGIEQLFPQLISLLGDKATYGVENPGYPLIRHVLECFQRKYLPLSIDEQGVVVDEVLKSNANILYLTPAHQFPNASILSANRRVKLLNWARESKDRYIIEDDYDSEFRYSGVPIPSLQSIAENDKVIYLSTFSKSLCPSLRIGYMVLPLNLMEKYQREFFFYSCTVSRVDQLILASFIKEGGFEKHLNRMRKAYKRKIEVLIEILSPYQKHISISGVNSGLHVLLHLKSKLSEKSIVEKARLTGIRIIGLSSYNQSISSAKTKGLVIGFGGLSETELRKALNLLIPIII